MSIDFLFELERSIDNGRNVYACPGISRNQWMIARSLEDLRKTAKRVADNSKMPVNIVRLVSKQEALAGDLFLVPIGIDEPGSRGEPQVRWRPVETKEAAEMMRDVRHGPAPYFAMQTEETVEPTSA